MYLHGQSSCHLYMTFQLLQNMTSGHIQVKKGTGHAFYLATPRHATESVDEVQEFLTLIVKTISFGQGGHYRSEGFVCDVSDWL